jgi:hypothetical protein
MSDLSSMTASEEMQISQSSFSLGESPTPLKPELWHSWLDFVYTARIQRGLYKHLELRQNSLEF